MLITNVIVAEFLLETCKDKAVVRVHNEISDHNLQELNDWAGKVGLEVDFGSVQGI